MMNYQKQAMQLVPITKEKQAKKRTRPVVKKSIIESGSSGDENDEYLMDTYVDDPHRT